MLVKSYPITNLIQDPTARMVNISHTTIIRAVCTEVSKASGVTVSVLQQEYKDKPPNKSANEECPEGTEWM